MSKLRLDGKVAIITGAASGIGEAAARLFVKNGALVVVADIQDELGHRVVASIGLEKASYRHCNVTDEKQVEETVAYALERYGTIDVLFSNAGILGSPTDILELDMEAFNTTIAVNVFGGAMMIKHVSRAMVAREIRGSIICTASVGASRGGLGSCAYTASKHAILGIVRSACSELGPYGIRVNCVSPFGVATPMTTGLMISSIVEAGISGMTNLKGIALKADHIADAALFLASDESAFVSGHDLVVDGGITAAHQSMTTYLVSLLSKVAAMYHHFEICTRRFFLSKVSNKKLV